MCMFAEPTVDHSTMSHALDHLHCQRFRRSMLCSGEHPNQVHDMSYYRILAGNQGDSTRSIRP